MTARGRRRMLGAAAVLLQVALLVWSVAVITEGAGRRSIAVICSSHEQVCREWADGFTRASGIEVQMQRLSTGEAFTRLSRTDGLGDFDVWHGGTADTHELAAQRGLLAPYTPQGADDLPTQYRDPEGLWHGTYLGVLGFCSNEAVLSRLGMPMPTRWDDLLDPRLAQQISVPNPVTSGTGYGLLWTTRLRSADEGTALAYLTQLDGNVLQYTTSGMAPARVVGRGEAAVGVAYTQHCLQARREGLEDIVVSYPEEGTSYEIGSVALLSGARDVQAARRYVDYAVSLTAQGMGRQLPTHPLAGADPELGQDAELLPHSAEEAAAARQELTEVWLTAVGR